MSDFDAVEYTLTRIACALEEIRDELRKADKYTINYYKKKKPGKE